MVDSKEKGKRFERQTVKRLNSLLSEKIGYEFHRVPGSGSYHHLNSTNMFGDIFTDFKEWPFIIECKNREAWNFNQLMSNSSSEFDSWINQVQNDCDRYKNINNKEKIPLIFFTKNKAPMFIAFKKEIKDTNHYNNYISNIIENNSSFMCYKDWIITTIKKQ